jgi:hypothetical protein
MIQYSLLGLSAALARLNATFRGLAPSSSSGKTDLTYCSLSRVFLPAAAGRADRLVVPKQLSWWAGC